MLIKIYQFLHDHYNDNKDWEFIHYFVYNLTFCLEFVSGAFAIIGILPSLILVIVQNAAGPAVLKITIGCAICAIICESIMNWIKRE